ncbi:colipase-like protein 1 [Erinaceus europaeus]|uniref:Colipase-like protein 1 n=1 Tax=Erinaceus europaeus TaxID=9365 RepID=A0A1S3WQR6_ERIEU|nr:colipase-like protein 1 [Erinaceus europaeus]
MGLRLLLVTLLLSYSFLLAKGSFGVIERDLEAGDKVKEGAREAEVFREAAAVQWSCQLEETGAGCVVFPQEVRESCTQSQRCKTDCCRREWETSTCASYCYEKGSEGSSCHTETFFGLYNECPCQPDLTCEFPKNQKSFKIIYGRCRKMKRKPRTNKLIF